MTCMSDGSMPSEKEPLVIMTPFVPEDIPPQISARDLKHHPILDVIKER